MSPIRTFILVILFLTMSLSITAKKVEGKSDTCLKEFSTCDSHDQCCGNRCKFLLIYFGKACKKSKKHLKKHD